MGIVDLMRCPECGQHPGEITREVPKTERVRFVCLGRIESVVEARSGCPRMRLKLSGTKRMPLVFGVMGQRVWVTATAAGEMDHGGARRILAWLPNDGMEIDGAAETIVEGDFLWLEVGETA